MNVHSDDICEGFEIKNKAQESRMKPCQVVQDLTVKLEIAVQPHMPNKTAVRKVISRLS